MKTALLVLIALATLAPFVPARAEMTAQSMCEASAIQGARVFARNQQMAAGGEVAPYPGPEATALERTEGSDSFRITLATGRTYEVSTQQGSYFCVVTGVK